MLRNTTTSSAIERVCDCCKSGDLSALKRLQATGQLPNLMSKNQLGEYPHLLAVSQNNLEILKWLVHDSGQTIDLTALSNLAISLAAQFGFLDILKWLFQESQQQLDITDDNFFAVTTTIEAGDLALIFWFLFECPQQHELLHALPAFSNLALEFWSPEEPLEYLRHLCIHLMLQARLKTSGISTLMTSFRDVLLGAAAIPADKSAEKEQKLQEVAACWFGLDPNAFSTPTAFYTCLRDAPVQVEVAVAISTLLDRAGVAQDLHIRKKYFCSTVAQKAAKLGIVDSFAELESLLERSDARCTRL